MAQQQILKLIEMPDHTPENPSLNESHIARHNLIDAKGLSPTEEELKAEETRLLEEYASSKYQRDRRYRYPRLEEQLDKLFHAIDTDSDLKTKFSDFHTAIKTVKDKYPKPE